MFNVMESKFLTLERERERDTNTSNGNIITERNYITQVVIVVFRFTFQDCKCCKEGRLVSRQIALQECYSNGVVLAGVQPTTSITEPADCDCFPCTN